MQVEVDQGRHAIEEFMLIKRIDGEVDQPRYQV